MYGVYYHDVAVFFDGTRGHRLYHSRCDQRHPVDALLSLIVLLLAVAGMFMIVAAPFWRCT